MVIDKLKNRINRVNKSDWKYHRSKIKVMNNLQGKNWRLQKAHMQVSSEVKGFRKHLGQNFWTLAVSTFGIANGLVWYAVWNTIVSDFFPDRSTLSSEIYVAIVVTLFSITATYIITRLRDRNVS